MNLKKQSKPRTVGGGRPAAGGEGHTALVSRDEAPLPPPPSVPAAPSAAALRRKRLRWMGFSPACSGQHGRAREGRARRRRECDTWRPWGNNCDHAIGKLCLHHGRRLMSWSLVDRGSTASGSPRCQSTGCALWVSRTLTASSCSALKVPIFREVSPAFSSLQGAASRCLL